MRHKLISNFKEIDVSLSRDSSPLSIFDILSDASPSGKLYCKKDFDFDVLIDGKQYRGVGKCGDDALWLPIKSYFGIKIIHNNNKYTDLQTTLLNIQTIRNLKSNIFPKIYFAQISHDQASNERFLVLGLEVIKNNIFLKVKNKIKLFFELLKFIPLRDIKFTMSKIFLIPSSSLIIAKEFLKCRLIPEDEWYKPNNFINGKIVDFHRFRIDSSKYLFKSNSLSSSLLDDKYNSIINRYEKLFLDDNSVPRWKGSMYQGFIFDNEYSMKGYSSDGFIYDSYRKLSFIPFNKCLNRNVLDLGSNQGFFTLQAAMHGANNAIGVELQYEDYEAAKDIKNITKIQEVDFINIDVQEYIFNLNDRFELVIMNSVLHQIYPNFVGSHDFLSMISSKCTYFSFETPLNHPLMSISIKEVFSILNKYYSHVRLVNAYNAYSSGYRANFICMNL